MLIKLIVAFNLGLFSSLHCIGMCGGFISALMLARTDSDKGENRKILTSSLVYNIGRINSYCIAGLLLGSFGFALSEIVSKKAVNLTLQIITSIILIGVALNILGKFSLPNKIEKLGLNLWSFISPYGKKLLPINTLSKTFLFGFVWGFLPCGMVYSALLLSLASGTAFNGMLTMLFFGLGTLPAMVTAGYFVDYLNQFRQHKQLRFFTAAILILIAIAIPLWTVVSMGEHAHSQHSTHTLHQ